MKTLIAKSLVLGSLGLAIAAMLPSCVATYPAPVAANVHVGYQVNTLPYGYRTEVYSGTTYYVHNGYYYRPRGGRYVVVEAPRTVYTHGYHNNDVIVTRLPSGYRVVNYRGARYYQCRGVYYQQRGSGYVVVSRPY